MPAISIHLCELKGYCVDIIKIREETEATELRWKTSGALLSSFVVRMKKKYWMIYKSVDERMTKLHNTLHMLEDEWIVV